MPQPRPVRPLPRPLAHATNPPGPRRRRTRESPRPSARGHGSAHWCFRRAPARHPLRRGATSVRGGRAPAQLVLTGPTAPPLHGGKLLPAGHARDSIPHSDYELTQQTAVAREAPGPRKPAHTHTCPRTVRTPTRARRPARPSAPRGAAPFRAAPALRPWRRAPATRLRGRRAAPPGPCNPPAAWRRCPCQPLLPCAHRRARRLAGPPAAARQPRAAALGAGAAAARRRRPRGPLRPRGPRRRACSNPFQMRYFPACRHRPYHRKRPLLPPHTPTLGTSSWLL